IVEVLEVERDMSRNPVFQVMFTFQNLPASDELDLGEAALQSEDVPTRAAKFELHLSINESEQGLQLNMTYSSSLFRRETIHRMLQHYENLLIEITEKSVAQIGKLKIISNEESEQLTNDFGTASVEYPTEKTIIDLFEAQVKCSPASIAVISADGSLTYQELDEQSNQLAHYLCNIGIQNGAILGICFDRSIKMMVSILGVLKTGAAYLPIDPDLPHARLISLLEGSKAAAIICDEEYFHLFNAEESGRIIICYQADAAKINVQIRTKPKRYPTPESLMYVIYTSGSTGEPKGVLIKHESVVDYLYGLDSKTKVFSCRSFALVSTIAADLGNTVIYCSLISGATLHIVSKEIITNPNLMFAYVEKKSIECLKIVPSHWKALCVPGQLILPHKLLIFGGEALEAGTVAMIHQLKSEVCVVVNHYGPTETTIGKLLFIVPKNALFDRTVPIGQPFSNTTVVVLDKNRQLCPVGVPGQLYIGGKGLSTGYINRPDLTLERFVDIKIPGKQKLLMYDTGDTVKYTAGGNIIFLGRSDQQVKIRGYRIEPGEIETSIRKSGMVDDVAIVTVNDRMGELRLIGYVAVGSNFDQQQLKAYLRLHLPDYMVPNSWVVMESMPLTKNGKIDRRSLPAINNESQQLNIFEAPGDAIEIALASIWKELLGLDQIGIHDNFFELGGHSLLAVKIVHLIQKNLDVELRLDTIFALPTIGELAKFIKIYLNNSLMKIENSETIKL
ncbi:MAG: amino acid adenylation domain-containing protein, partial [Chitinophagaceae bacterium]